MSCRSITAFFALALALGTAPALAGPPAVIEADIPFYEGPGEHFPSLGIVGKGVHVRLLGCQGDWCMILRRTQKGWVPSNAFKLEYGQASAVDVPGAESAGLIPDMAAATSGGSSGGSRPAGGAGGIGGKSGFVAADSSPGGSSGGSRPAGGAGGIGGKSGFVAAGSGDSSGSSQGSGSPTFSTTQTITRSDDTGSKLSGGSDQGKASLM